jgi:photosystem II stability/assembly factor-like uncharacterized protein
MISVFFRAMPVGTLLLALLIPSTAIGTPAWHWSHPSPTGWIVNSMQFVDGETGWMTTGYAAFPSTSTDFGELFRTLDGGATWQELGEMDPVMPGLFFLSSSEGWICGYTGIIRHTTNGGQTWSQQGSGTGNDLFAIQFSDPMWGTAVGEDGTILRTNNGGSSWSPQGSGTTLDLLDVCFVDPDNGWVSVLFYDNTAGWVLHTSSAGAFWQQQPIGFTSYSESALDFTSLTEGWLATYTYNDASILRTVDGGATWTRQLLCGSNSRLYDLDMHDSVNGAACGTDGRVALTGDGGSLWETYSIGWIEGIYPDLFSVSMPEASRVFSGGEGGALFETTDLTDWDALSNRMTFSDLISVCSVSGDEVWACGESGTILHSSDAGAGWEIQDVPASVAGQLNDIVFLNEDNGFACGVGSPGCVIRTQDGGQTWEDCTPAVPSLKTLFSIDFADPLNGVAVGDAGEIVVTHDGGDSWTRVSGLSTKHLGDICFGDDMSGLVAGDDGTVLHFDLSADSWAIQYSGTSQDLYGLFCLNSDTAWTVGWNGLVLRTYNGGTNWTQVAMTGNDYGDVWFADALNGFLTGLNGVEYTTSNGGQTMTRMAGNRHVDLRSCCFQSLAEGWGCGPSGTIMRFGEEMTGIEDPEPPGPVQPTILHVSPNPFSGSAAVSFRIPVGASDYWLGLFDLSGRLMLEIEDSAQPGDITVELDAVTLPTGVYVVRLECGGTVQTRTCARLP